MENHDARHADDAGTGRPFHSLTESEIADGRFALTDPDRKDPETSGARALFAEVGKRHVNEGKATIVHPCASAARLRALGLVRSRPIHKMRHGKANPAAAEGGRRYSLTADGERMFVRLPADLRS